MVAIVMLAIAACTTWLTSVGAVADRPLRSNSTSVVDRADGANAMSNPYREVAGWPALPPEFNGGAIIGLIPDGAGGLWLQRRANPSIVHLDRSGNMLQSFGAGMFVNAHGFCRDRAQNFWANDDGAGQVFKISADGRILLTLGKRGVLRAGTDTFLGPTACVVSPEGDVIIADGHWPRSADSQQDGDRLVRYSKDGKFIAAYGKLGQGPGEFIGPHSLAFDSQGRLFVADRSNNRLVILDRQMAFVDDWRHFGRPSGVAILEDDTLIVSDSESGRTIGGAGSPASLEGAGRSVRNPGWKTGIRIGSARDGSLKYFVPVAQPEAVAADEFGSIFVGLTSGCGPTRSCIQKYVRSAP